jgi:hypothetical protein
MSCYFCSKQLSPFSLQIGHYLLLLLSDRPVTKDPGIWDATLYGCVNGFRRLFQTFVATNPTTQRHIPEARPKQRPFQN